MNDSTDQPAGEERSPVASGLEHLQQAARELIAAARSVLDAAEDLLDDPATAEAVISGVRTVVSAVARAARPGEGEPAAGGSTIERIDVG